MEEDIPPEIAGLSLDEQFRLLPRKKIMRKEGSAKRRLKKYYKDRYAKTGAMPKPLPLEAKGVFEGRRCSGRAPGLDEEVKRRFAEMAEASADMSDERLMFASGKARTIKNYRCRLEEEFGRTISLHALGRFAKRSGLRRHLEKPDFGEEQTVRHSFKSEPVFGLLQMDGCAAEYIRIRDSAGRRGKPDLIEIYSRKERKPSPRPASISTSNNSEATVSSKPTRGDTIGTRPRSGCCGKSRPRRFSTPFS